MISSLAFYPFSPPSSLFPSDFPALSLIVGGAALYGLLTGFLDITGTTILFLLAGAVVAESAEAAAGIVGARKYGSGNLGIFASMGGGNRRGRTGRTLLLRARSDSRRPGGGLRRRCRRGTAERPAVLREAFRAGWGTFIGRLAGTGLEGCRCRGDGRRLPPSHLLK